jgi:hypothetical protein
VASIYEVQQIVQDVVKKLASVLKTTDVVKALQKVNTAMSQTLGALDPVSELKKMNFLAGWQADNQVLKMLAKDPKMTVGGGDVKVATPDQMKDFIMWYDPSTPMRGSSAYMFRVCSTTTNADNYMVNAGCRKGGSENLGTFAGVPEGFDIASKAKSGDFYTVTQQTDQIGKMTAAAEAANDRFNEAADFFTKSDFTAFPVIKGIGVTAAVVNLASLENWKADSKTVFARASDFKTILEAGSAVADFVVV